MTQEVPHSCPPDPLVSVVTVTYQHAPYIGACVESVLAQEAPFPIEHLIGEDGSTDGTREACLALAHAHPGRIRLFLRDRKDVIHIMGRPTGRANVLALYEAARGKYIAVCPGDDHWTDPGKLARQVALMESRPELSACFTNAWNERDGVREDYVRAWLRGEVPKRDVVLDDIVARNFIPSQTFLFRRDLLFPLPAAFWTAPISDHLLVVHMAMQGPIAYEDTITAVRRVHAGGIISMKSVLHRLDVNIGMMEAIGTLVGAGHPRVREQQVALHRSAVQYAIDRNDGPTARAFWARLLALPGVRVGMRERLRMAVLLYAPALARIIHRLRS